MVFGFLSDPNLKGFVLNIATPLLPIITFCIEQYKANKESIENLENLKQDLTSSWHEILANPSSFETEATSRRIQDEIYKNRKDNQLIFDWLYSKYRDKTEGAMYYSVDEMMNEYKNSVSF
jgi:SMODS-associating 4TM effector domain